MKGVPPVPISVSLPGGFAALQVDVAGGVFQVTGPEVGDRLNGGVVGFRQALMARPPCEAAHLALRPNVVDEAPVTGGRR